MKDNAKLFYIAEILGKLCTDVVPSAFPDEADREYSELRKNIYAGHRPSAKSRIREFIVVKTSANIGDHYVYQQASVYLDVHVRNLENGLENTMRLQRLIDCITKIFPYVSDDGRWVVKNPSLFLRGDDGLEFSVWRIRASLQVNTTDRFAI